MIDLHPSILRKNGKPEFVVLPYEEIVQIQEYLADAEDLRELRSAKSDEQGAPTQSLEQIRQEVEAADGDG